MLKLIFKLLFKKKDKSEALIITRVTKTSDMARTQKEIEDKAYKQAKKCPKCYSETNPGFPLSYANNYRKHVYHNTCKSCGTEWETVYTV